MLKETNQKKKKKKKYHTCIPCIMVERLRQQIWSLALERTQINPLSPVTLEMLLIYYVPQFYSFFTGEMEGSMKINIMTGIN